MDDEEGWITTENICDHLTGIEKTEEAKPAEESLGISVLTADYAMQVFWFYFTPRTFCCKWECQSFLKRDTEFCMLRDTSLNATFVFRSSQIQPSYSVQDVETILYWE